MLTDIAGPIAPLSPCGFENPEIISEDNLGFVITAGCRPIDHVKPEVTPAFAIGATGIRPQVVWNCNLVDAYSGRCRSGQEDTVGGDYGDSACRKSDPTGERDLDIARLTFRDTIECAGIPAWLISNKQKGIWTQICESNISIGNIPEFQVMIDAYFIIGESPRSRPELDLANTKSIFLNERNALLANRDYLVQAQLCRRHCLRWRS